MIAGSIDTVLAFGGFEGAAPLAKASRNPRETVRQAYIARPLEDAFRTAQHDIVTWVAQLCDLDPIGACQRVSQAVESPLANVCDPNYPSIRHDAHALPAEDRVPRGARAPRVARRIALDAKGLLAGPCPVMGGGS